MVKNPKDTIHTVTDNYGWAKTGVHARLCLRLFVVALVYE